MKNKTQQEKLLRFGISSLALGVFPLIWFLSQAILFRELTEQLTRNIVVLIAIPFGSLFIFLLFYGMNKLIDFAPKDARESLEARMFVGPGIFMILLFHFNLINRLAITTKSSLDYRSATWAILTEM